RTTWGINILYLSVKSVVKNSGSGYGILTTDDTDTNWIKGDESAFAQGFGAAKGLGNYILYLSV
ncbi:MAG: hypothetical protein ABI273_06345, partial [Lacunisphaera sp.]